MLKQTSISQYAVIAVRNEPQRKRLFISYPNEKVPRDLIAAPSIVTAGYCSREEAPRKHRPLRVDYCCLNAGIEVRNSRSAGLLRQLAPILIGALWRSVGDWR